MTHGNKVYERHNITLRLQLLSLCTRRELGLYPWTPLGDYRPQTPRLPLYTLTLQSTQKPANTWPSHTLQNPRETCCTLSTHFWHQRKQA